MNKAELIEYVARNAKLSKVDAGRALEAVTDGITQALKNGDSVLIVGFGGFSVSERSAREGRNPRTGEVVQIAASKAPKFTPGKGLREAIN
jgi:nucleoid DNA-binding protein